MAANLRLIIIMKKRNQLLCFVLFISISAIAQNSGNNHLKKTITICSLIKEGNGGTIAKDAPLILSMQDSSANKKVELVFTRAIRESMSYDPYSKLVNQTVCVTGKLTQYKNAPAIIIHNEKQIQTSDKQQVDRPNPNH